MTRAADLLRPTPDGLYCEAGGFHIDPVRPVDRAIITHGHSDHARPSNGAVLASPETIAIARARLGDNLGRAQALKAGETLRLGGVSVRLVPAGHILGSSQVVIEKNGARIVVSGDYKRRPDPTCLPFEPVTCDIFVTEATFGLPVFRHPSDAEEIGKILHALSLYPERCVLVGVYALGKCQRVLSLLRRQGYDAAVYVHGALLAMNEAYRALGIELGPTLPATGAPREEMRGKIVLAPPSATTEIWARRLPEPVVGMASGWMRVKQRAKQRGVELPVILSDHADWDELVATIEDVAAPEIWVTHGSEEGLVRQATLMGRKARALSLVGFEEDEA